MRRGLLVMVLLVSLQVSAQSRYAERMAQTVMQLWPDSFSLDNKPAKWAYDMGVILKGMESLWINTGNADYFRYLQKQMDVFVDDKGNIKTYAPEEYNIDHINNGKLLLLLYRVTEKEKYLRAAHQLRAQLQTHPRTQQGSFWHKKIYPSQVWLDGLYMAQPFYAEYALLSHEDTAFNDIANQFVWIEQHTRDIKTGLLYHGSDESKQQQWANKSTGTSPLFWARAMGWYATALVDALDYFPAEHPRKKELVAILNRLVNAITLQQDKTTGVWKDILAYHGKNESRNYFEASASCQFVYAIAKGVRKGYLPAARMAIATKGYAGITKQFVKDENGAMKLSGTVKVSGLGGKPYRDGSFDYYMSEPVIDNDPKGLGAFLLAATEMEFYHRSPAKKPLVLLDNYFNHEQKKDAFGATINWHYRWEEKDNGGFSVLGNIFEKQGANISMLAEPTTKALQQASVYIICDPDFEKENPQPNFIEPKHIDVIYNYVKNGGVLLLMANDSGNVEFKHFNELAKRFGIQFNENLRHDVKNDQFEQGAVLFEKHNPVFKSGSKAYIKQLCTQSISSPAYAVYSEQDEVMISAAKLGKGMVLAVGDPWFYNEYLDGRKLPDAYRNYEAAEDMAQWLLQHSTR